VNLGARVSTERPGEVSSAVVSARAQRSGERADGRIWQSPGRKGKREHDEAPGHGPERGSKDDWRAHECEHVAEGARGQGSKRSWPGGGGAGGARAPCRMRAMGVGVGDDCADTHAAAACSAAGDVEQVGERDAEGTCRRRRRSRAARGEVRPLLRLLVARAPRGAVGSLDCDRLRMGAVATRVRRSIANVVPTTPVITVCGG